MTISKRFTSFILLFSLFFLMGQGCRGNSAAERAAAEPVEIEIWRVFDGQETFSTIMNNYRAIHPNVSFVYREVRMEEYKDELLRAFAEGEGPDVFSVHNSWIGEWENLIRPLPDSVTIPFTEERGTVRRETVTTLREIPSLSLRALRQDFLDIVSEDVVRPYRPNPNNEPIDRIFGLPMGVDTMALFYNRDLLNAAGIAQPPQTWSEFQENVVSLTSISENDVIQQSGAAIGTSQNVERSFDILSLLMLQNGTPMLDDRGQATFSRETDRDFVPAENAVRFYTDFANPLKEVYTWNADQPESFDAFTTGKTAFFFGYSYHIPFIRSQAPRLNFEITNMPQIGESRTVNYANYWVESVAKASEHSNWAWDFIQFATGPEQVTSYLEATGKPTARRALIQSQIEMDDLFIFASQLLTSTSWYRGDDAEVAEDALLDLIDITLQGGDLSRALRDAQNQVNQTL